MGGYPPQGSAITQIEVIAQPKGGIIEKGYAGTTGDYQTIVSYTVTEGETFNLTKTIVSCDQNIMYRLVWDNEVIGMEILLAATVPFPDWYPYDYYQMEGDGSKAFEIQAKYPAGGSTGTCHAEIVGEES